MEITRDLPTRAELPCFSRCIFISGLLLFATLPLKADRAATKVISRVGPSVVEVSTLNGHGTGIAISRDGLILTNKHVVDSLVILGVKVQIERGQSGKAVVHRKVRLLKVHPTLDLAVIKVDAPTSLFSPVNIDSAPKITMGMECYAVGLPTGVPSLDALNISITKGIVSATKVRLHNGNYIQTTAPINPGNSGGPLCSSTGKVLGVITAKLEGTDSIGFAIPISSIKLSDFREVNLHKAPAGTLQQAVDATEKKIQEAAELSKFDQIEVAQQVIKDYAAIIRDHGPSNKLISRLGEIHINLGFNHSAALCFMHVMDQDPQNLMAIWYLGATAWNDDQAAEAHAIWEALLHTDPKTWAEEAKWAALTISGHGRSLLQQGRMPAAAYCFLWARSLWAPVANNPIHPDNLTHILEQARRDEPSFADWADKASPYSLQALEHLSKLTPGKDRHDRYATDFSVEGFRNDAPSVSRATYDIELPEGALNIRIKNAKPGMRVAPEGSKIIWDNAPASHAATKIMVLYEKNGQSAYKIVTIPATSP